MSKPLVRMAPNAFRALSHLSFTGARVCFALMVACCSSHAFAQASQSQRDEQPTNQNDPLAESTWNPSTASQHERQITVQIRDELKAIATSLGTLSKSPSDGEVDALRKLNDTLALLEKMVKERPTQDDIEARVKHLQAQVATLKVAIEKRSQETPPSVKPYDPPKPATPPTHDDPPPTIDKTTGKARKKPSAQIDPWDNLADVYPAASFEYMAVGVPDPRVERHKRAYEFSIGAITAGMADAHFELDRYWFPWVEYRDDKGDSDVPSKGDCQRREIDIGSSIKAHDLKGDDANRLPSPCFGVMIFRQDRWREAGADLLFRVVYVLPETVTYGVQPLAVNDMLVHIAQRLPPQSSQLWHVDCPLTSSLTPDRKALLIAGPAFSGSATSYGLAMRISDPDRSVCLASYAATVKSNAKLADYDDRLTYAQLTIDDDAKREQIFELADHLGFVPPDVLFFVEQTTFGDSACPATDGRCRFPGSGNGNSKEADWNVVLFDSNIAEVRERHAEQEAQDDKDARLTDMMNPQSSRVLRLDDTSENGNEYPINKQSPLAVAGIDLALSRQIQRLKHYGKMPRMIVIAATEVRDRLYLISAIKETMPWVVTVDLESDILLSHPDFIPATRGSVMLGSAPIRYGRIRSMQTDRELILRDLVATAQDKPTALLAITSNISFWWSVMPMSATVAPVLSQFGHSADRQYISIIGRNGPQAILISYPETQAGGIKIREYIGSLIFAMGFIVLVRLRWWWWRRWIFRVNAISGILAGIVLTAALACATCVALYVLLDQKNETLDKILVCILAAIMVWVIRQSLGLWGLSPGNICQRLGRCALRVRVSLLRTIPGRTITLGIALGLLACTVATPKIALPAFVATYRVLQSWLRQLICSLGWSKYCESTDPAYSLLDISVTDGLAIAVTYIGTAVLTLLAVCIVVSVAELRAANRSLWLALREGTGIALPCLLHREGARISRSMFWFYMLVAIYMLSPWKPLGASGLGVAFDVAYFVAMLATATTAFGALALTFASLQRVIECCDGVVRYCKTLPGTPFLSEWRNVGPAPFSFVYTPIAVSRDPWFAPAIVLANAAAILSGAPLQDSVSSRTALALMLSAEIAAIRALLLLAMLSCFAGVLLVYAFPVPRRDSLLFIDLALMVLAALASGYCTISLERHPLISRILCDDDKGLHVSLPLIRALALPFVLIAVSLLIAEVPGVREWSGSYLGALLKFIVGG